MRGRTPRLITALSLTVVVVTSLVSVAVSAGAAARQIPPNFNTTAMRGNEAEDAIAVNPTNPLNVVTMATLPDVPAGLAVSVSFDGGATWARRIVGATAGDPLGDDICCDEQLAWDRFGNLWMTYLFNVSGNVPIAVSTDGGLSFQKVTEIVPIKPKGVGSPAGAQPKRIRLRSALFGDQPSISTGPGSVWVSYTVFPSTVIQAAGARVTGLGTFGKFTRVQNVPTSNGKGDYGDTAVGPRGQVMVAYQSATSGQGGSYIYTSVDPDGLGPKGFNEPRLLAHSRVGGFDYIPAQPDRSVDAETSLAYDRSGGPHNGRVYVIWTQEVKSESDNMDIRFQYSDNNGRTWTSPVRLNDDAGRNSQFNPAIALDQATGFVGVSWYDARNDLGAGGPGDTDGIRNDDAQVWATFSRNGGVSFAPNFQVSLGASNAADAESYFDYGDYTHAAFQSHHFYPAWSDNSNSTGDNPDGTLHKLDLYTANITI
jgi:hypothetical protein